MRRLAIAALVTLAACGAESPVTPTPFQPVDPPADPTPGVVAQLAVTAGTGQTAPVMTELPVAIMARATDSRGVAVSDQLVNWVVVEGGGHVFAGSALTDDAGAVRERWTLGPAAGEQVLEARAVDQVSGDPITFARITATATPGPVDSLVLPATLPYIYVDSVVDLSAAFTALDAYGNVVSGAAIALNIGEGAPVTQVGPARFRGDTVGYFNAFAGANGHDTPIFEVRSVYDLRPHSWRGTFACEADAPNDNFTWPDGTPVIGLSSTLIVDSVRNGLVPSLYVHDSTLTHLTDGRAMPTATNPRRIDLPDLVRTGASPETYDADPTDLCFRYGGAGFMHPVTGSMFVLTAQE